MSPARPRKIRRCRWRAARANFLGRERRGGFNERQVGAEEAQAHQSAWPTAVCIFCGGATPASTIDHQPARSFFDAKLAPEGYEFPACEPCNKKSKDQEHVLTTLVRLSQDGQQNGQREIDFAKVREGDEEQLSRLAQGARSEREARLREIPRCLRSCGPCLSSAASDGHDRPEDRRRGGGWRLRLEYPLNRLDSVLRAHQLEGGRTIYCHRRLGKSRFGPFRNVTRLG
jgi:hypothetical protein